MTTIALPVDDWTTAGPFEFPRRITPKWIMARAPYATAEWFVALRDELRDRGWGGPTGNGDVEWFVWRCLPQAEQRRLSAMYAEGTLVAD